MFIKILLKNIPKTQPWTRYLTSSAAQKIPSYDSTVDPKDIQRFEELSKNWWNRNGPMLALHSLNEIRFVLFLHDLRLGL